MKRIKFPLIMKNGAEVREIEELRENFDIESITEYYTNGKLERWLENNYYDDILDKLKEMDEGGKDFGRHLAEALGVEWKNEEKVNLENVMKKTALKERLKPYVSEEKLERMEYIADTQEGLEQLARAGYTPIYLFGEEFKILGWMECIEYIGINCPVVSLELESPEEFKRMGIKLREVSFADDDMKKLTLNASSEGVYYQLLDVMESYLEKVRKKMAQ